MFHYIEHFQEHKQDGACIGVSTLRDETNTDQKTQVWGFLLWKNAKFKNDADNANDSSSWSIYQQWCNLEIPQKDAWIAAGQSILLSYKIGTAKAPETTSTSCQVRYSVIYIYGIDLILIIVHILDNFNKDC